MTDYSDDENNNFALFPDIGHQDFNFESNLLVTNAEK
jgi:hypothetical protein